MANYSWPTASAFTPSSVQWGQRTNCKVFVSALSGETQTVEFPGARWLVSLTWDTIRYDEAQSVEAYLVKLRGQVHRALIYHIARPAPTGTMRGSPTLASTAAQGAASLSITCSSGATLKAGDMLGVGSQLVMASADATASGTALTVTIEPPLRASVSSGTAVVWDKPTAMFVLASNEPRVTYLGGGRPGQIAADFVEVFA